MLLAVQNASVLRQMARAGRPQSAGLIAEAVGRDVDNVRKSLKLLEGEGLLQLVTVDGLKCADLTSEGRDVVPRLDVLDGKASLNPNAPELRHDEIEPDPLNPRKSFPRDELEDLADGIEQARGLIQSIAVKPTADPALFRIVDGERRWRSIGILIERGSWPRDRRIPCSLRHVEDDLDHALTSLIANVQRADMNPIDEANEIERQIAGGRKVGDLSTSLGKTRRFVEKRRQLLKLPEILQVEVARGVTSIEKALATVQAHKPAEPQAPAPQAATGAGPNLTPAQALIMIEVAHAAEGVNGEATALGPAVGLHAVVPLQKHPDAQALMAEGLLMFSTSFPAAVAILRPGRDWLQANAWPQLDRDERLRLIRNECGAFGFLTEQLEAEGGYHTPWLNRPKPLPAPVVSDTVALIMLEVLDAITTQNRARPAVNADKALIEQVRAETGGFVQIFGPSWDDGRFGAHHSGEWQRALAGRWPEFRDPDARKAALAEIRAAVLPAKDLKILERRGGYATPWLNGPFKPCPEWARRKADEQAAEAKRLADRTALQEARERNAEAISVFESAALEMTEPQIRQGFNEMLTRISAPAPWWPADHSNPKHTGAWAVTSEQTVIMIAQSPSANRLAVLAVNIAAGIPPAQWGQPDEPEDQAKPTKACASCAAQTPEDELDEDGACADCVAAEEADADAEAAGAEA